MYCASLGTTTSLLKFALVTCQVHGHTHAHAHSIHFFLFNKTNKMHELPKFHFVKNLHMFWAFPLPIIRSFLLYIRHWYISCGFDDSFQAGSGWNWFYSVTGSILNLLGSCHQTRKKYTSVECTVENS
jgi:hypothetical protein